MILRVIIRRIKFLSSSPFPLIKTKRSDCTYDRNKRIHRLHLQTCHRHMRPDFTQQTVSLYAVPFPASNKIYHRPANSRDHRRKFPTKRSPSSIHLPRLSAFVSNTRGIPAREERGAAASRASSLVQSTGPRLKIVAI